VWALPLVVADWAALGQLIFLEGQCLQDAAVLVMPVCSAGGSWLGTIFQNGLGVGLHADETCSDGVKGDCSGQ
jgi:hypothetical protein